MWYVVCLDFVKQLHLKEKSKVTGTRQAGRLTNKARENGGCQASLTTHWRTLQTPGYTVDKGYVQPN